MIPPCPFCGKSVARFAGLNLGMSGYRHVYCDPLRGGCGASGGSVHYDLRSIKDDGGPTAQQAQDRALQLWVMRGP